jgi:hypothetical protein
MMSQDERNKQEKELREFIDSMKLWECNYKVNTGYTLFEMRDYIWSTSEPTKESIGHYWRTLFPSYVISDEQTKETVYYEGMNLDARMLSHINLGI